MCRICSDVIQRKGDGPIEDQAAERIQDSSITDLIYYPVGFVTHVSGLNRRAMARAGLASLLYNAVYIIYFS